MEQNDKQWRGHNKGHRNHKKIGVVKYLTGWAYRREKGVGWMRGLGGAIGSSTSAEYIKCVCIPHDGVFSLPGQGLGPCGKSRIGFRQCAVGGRLQLTRDDLVRCERALSNLEGNKLKVIFYEASIPGCLWAPPPPRCALSAQLMCL